MTASADITRPMIPASWMLGGIALLLLGWAVLASHPDDAITIGTVLAFYSVTTCVASMVALLAYWLGRQPGGHALHWLGLGALGCAVMCGFPLLELHLGWPGAGGHDSHLAWFWFAERIIGGIAALGFVFSSDRPLPQRIPGAFTALVLVSLIAAGVLFLPIDYPVQADWSLTRPMEYLPGLLFFVALVIKLNRQRPQSDGYRQGVMLYFLLALCIQFGFVAFSNDMLDAFFRDSLILRLVSLLVLFGALLLWAQQRLHEQAEANAVLQRSLDTKTIEQRRTDNDTLTENHQQVSRKVLLSLMEDFHRAREQEAEAKQFAESIIENMPMMIFVKDAQDLRFQRINKAAEKLLGMPRKQFLNKTDYEVFTRSEADHFTTVDRKVLSGDTVVDIGEESVNTPLGTRWLHTRKIPVKNARGKPLYLLGISEDITERRELEQRFTLLFEVAPNGLMLVRQDNHIVLVNKACCDVFGYSREELLNQTLDKLLPTDRSSEHGRMMHNYWVDPAPRKMGTVPNLAGTHKDGHRIPLDIALQPLPWQGELYVLAAITDITERQRFIEQLEQTSRYKSLFLANMSHELRTPMNSIIGFTEKVLKSANSTLDERQQDALLTVRRNAHHLLRLINDVLDLSRIEAGRMDIEQEEVDLCQQLNLLRTEFTQLAKSKGLLFQLVLPAEPILLHTDHRKLIQICHNLMSNAVKYTEQGSVKLTVSIVQHPELQRCVCLQFSDTGLGISVEDQHKLFKEFGRAAEAKQLNIPGTGLGLLITAQLVSLLGGRISFESVHGKGSTFTVLLPMD